MVRADGICETAFRPVMFFFVIENVALCLGKVMLFVVRRSDSLLSDMVLSSSKWHFCLVYYRHYEYNSISV